MKYKNIVIAGEVGAGKSTLAKELSAKLSWKCISVGSFFRAYMPAHHLPLFETKGVAYTVERQVEAAMLELIEHTDNIICEGHFQGWNARNCTQTYKILVTLDWNTTIERIKERGNETTQEATERKFQNHVTFHEVYGLDNYLDPKYFNLVITNDKSIDEAATQPYEAFKIAQLSV